MVNEILQVITVDNGPDEYPGGFTSKENQLIIEMIQKTHCKNILHLFSGNSTIGNIRVDIANENATHNEDVFSFLEHFDQKVDCIILDPPYNEKFADKYNKKLNIEFDQFIIFAQTEKTSFLFNKICALAPKYIIMKSWQYYIPKNYLLQKGYLCYPGGFRKPTFLLFMRKENQTLI